MALSWSASKDPDDIKDYVLDWADRLAGDTIVTSVWSIEQGESLAIDSQSNTDDVTTVWLSGGVEGTALVLNRVTTSGGRTYDQTMKLKIKTA